MKIKLKCPTCDYRTEYEIEDNLEAIKTHLLSYPDEYNDEVYSIASDLRPRFNSVLFLTHLATWKKELDEILGSSEFKENQDKDALSKM